MKYLPVMLLCLSLASCAQTKTVAIDPIDVLVKRLDADNGIWLNGGSPEVDLPQDANPKEVIALAIRKQSFNQGMIKSYKIRTMRQVDLPNHAGEKVKFTAAFLDTDLGPKVIVCNFTLFGYWWTRFFPASEEKQNRLAGD